MTKLRDSISSRMKRYKSYLIIYHQRARSSWWAVLLYWQGFLFFLTFGINFKKPPKINLDKFKSLVSVPLKKRNFNVRLLDIDHRFLSIFPSNIFNLFNMMNCHFFTKSDDFDSFVKTKRLTIIADPPFGVQIDVLMRTLNLLGEKAERTFYLVFFPWFHHKRFEQYNL